MTELRRAFHNRLNGLWAVSVAAVFIVLIALPSWAQTFRFNTIEVDGNRRIETSTIASFAGIETGAALTASEVNDAIQRVRRSGLFESVDAEVRGTTLRLIVVEFPTVNRVAFEGNSRISDEALAQIATVAPRRIYSSNQVAQDAARLSEAYANQGRLLATVTPRIIRRSDNRVDVVFEVQEGGVVEIERISFVGNRSFSDRRLRRVLETKQAGFFRLLVSRDTFVEDRIQFDRQVLSDFYQSRGYVDFETLGVNSELAPERDGFFLTFRVREGQQFRFGEITTTTDLADVDPLLFERALRARVAGNTYSPSVVEDTITRMERRAVQLGLDFIRVEPRINRNDADLTLDVEYAITRGPRVFVERIDIEGNTTTLDRVVRRQFRIVEGDPFNPREIRASAERIRALGFFGNADVNARTGSDPSQVVIDVDVTEQPTGSFSFGANFNTDNGLGFVANFRESNFLGRGQALSFGLVTGEESRSFNFNFREPALLDRDLVFDFGINYRRTDNNNARYDTESLRVTPALGFSVGENSRLFVRGFYETEELFDVSTSSGAIQNEATSGTLDAYGIGYTYSYDTRRSGIDDRFNYFFRFGQDYTLGGDQDYLRTTMSTGAEWAIGAEDVTFSIVFEGGALEFPNKNGRVTDRNFPSSDTFRGFEPGGIGPRELNGTDNDGLGGNYFAVVRLESRFPLGLPDEYGISGGVFADFGSVWGLDDATVNAANAAGGQVLYEDFSLRSTAGVSLFWRTPIGPLRFNWSRALESEQFDETENFDLSISTSF